MDSVVNYYHDQRIIVQVHEPVQMIITSHTKIADNEVKQT